MTKATVDPLALDPPAVPAPVAEQAVAWLLDLQDRPDDAGLRARWQHWRHADRAHEHAWQQIEAVNERLRMLGDSASGLPAAARQAAARQAILNSAGAGRRRRIKALAVLLAVGGGAWLGSRSAPVQQRMAQWRPPRGQSMRRSLGDGSQIVLAGGSAMNVAFDAGGRGLELLAGEVFVTSGHAAGETRPFFVITPYGRAVALGTRYSVRLPDQPGAQPGAQVSVFDGEVAVQTRQGRFLLNLRGGEQAFLTPGGVSAVERADANRSAWTQGSIVAQDMRLDALVAEFAPHAPYRIACDPRVAGLRLSGSYPLRDINMALESVAMMLGLRVERRARLLGGLEVRLEPA